MAGSCFINEIAIGGAAAEQNQENIGQAAAEFVLFNTEPEIHKPAKRLPV